MGGLSKPQTGKWRYDRDLDCMIEVRTGSNYFDYNDLRSDLACPAVHAGGMPTIKSMADGRYYETKRNYLKSVSRAGCEVIGFDKRWTEHIRAPGITDKELETDIVKDVKKSIEQEASKMPPAGSVADRKLMKKQRRAARASK